MGAHLFFAYFVEDCRGLVTVGLRHQSSNRRSVGKTYAAQLMYRSPVGPKDKGGPGAHGTSSERTPVDANVGKALTSRYRLYTPHAAYSYPPTLLLYSETLARSAPLQSCFGSNNPSGK